MQAINKEWFFDNISQLPNKEIKQLKEYVEFLVWKQHKTNLPLEILQKMEQSTEVTIEDANELLITIKKINSQ